MGKTDITHKSFFEDTEKFADLMNAVFFNGERIIEADELLSEDSVVQKADNGATLERLRDVVKKQTKDGSTFAIYILENQTTVDYGMLIRIMVEESLTYDKQIKKIRKRNKEKYGSTLNENEFICGLRKEDRLAPIFTLVLYWGDKEWDAAISLHEMVDIPARHHNRKEMLRELIPNYRIRVFDLNNVKDFSNFKTTLRTLFEFYSSTKNKETLKLYIKSHEKELGKMDEDDKFLLETMLADQRFHKILYPETNVSEEEEEKDMCRALDELIEEGKEEGREEGRVEAILLLLGEKGEISNEVVERITSEKDESVLKRWILLAAGSDSIMRFEEAM